MGQGDVPTSRGGPLRRRREKRQLEHLAASSDREGSPPPAAAHVKVLGDGAAAEPQALEARDRDAGDAADKADAPDERPSPNRTGGFHVRAVPIDQPLANEEV
jgi:hypothetical protein